MTKRTTTDQEGTDEQKKLWQVLFAFFSLSFFLSFFLSKLSSNYLRTL